MPDDVYQPNRKQSPSSETTSLHQEYKDISGVYHGRSRISPVSSTLPTTSRTLTPQGPADSPLETPMATSRTRNEGRLSLVTAVPHSPSVRDCSTPQGGRRVAIVGATVTELPTDQPTVHVPITTSVADMVGCTATVVSNSSPYPADQHHPLRLQSRLSSPHPRVRPADPAPHDT